MKIYLRPEQSLIMYKIKLPNTTDLWRRILMEESILSPNRIDKLLGDVGYNEVDLVCCLQIRYYNDDDGFFNLTPQVFCKFYDPLTRYNPILDETSYHISPERDVEVDIIRLYSFSFVGNISEYGFLDRYNKLIRNATTSKNFQKFINKFKYKLKD